MCNIIVIYITIITNGVKFFKGNLYYFSHEKSFSYLNYV